MGRPSRLNFQRTRVAGLGDRFPFGGGPLEAPVPSPSPRPVTRLRGPGAVFVSVVEAVGATPTLIKEPARLSRSPQVRTSPHKAQPKIIFPAPGSQRHTEPQGTSVAAMTHGNPRRT